MTKLSALVIVVIALWSSALPAQASTSADTPDIAIIGARIYSDPDAAPIVDGAVIIRNGKILTVGPRSKTRVPKGSLILDAKGGVLTAAFWNSHVHLLSPAQLNAASASPDILNGEMQAMFTRWGFTTVFDIASSTSATLALRKRIEAGEVIGPNILTVGDPFYPKDGTPIYVRDFYAANGFDNGEVATPEEAAARAQRQFDAGADGVKIFAGAIVGGAQGVLPMRADIAKTIVDQAHQRGKIAFAHPSNLAGLNVAIDAGVDVLAHPTTTEGDLPGGWTPELIARMRTRDMALIPTLSLMGVEHQRMGGGRLDVLARGQAMMIEEIRLYAKAGGIILFGTDVGYIDLLDTTEEYRLMSRALNWRQILASLTTAPADKFGFGKTKGRITKGMDADLVLLAGDPETDPTAFSKVQYTIRAGRIIWSARP